MYINIHQASSLTTTAGIPIRETTSFKYLGSHIPNSYTDFINRKGQAWAAMGKLSKIWKSSVSREVKLRFLNASVISILLYGSETWTVTKRLKKRIDGCYTRLLRKALNIRWQAHVTNATLYQDLPKLSRTVQKRRLRFAGHCVRATNQPVSNLIFWTPQGGRTNRGQPQKTYSKTLMEDTALQDQTQIKTYMEDKQAWNDIIENTDHVLNNTLMISPPTGDR